MTINSFTSQIDFRDLGVSTSLIHVLNKNKILTPTPIQKKSIPLGLEGKDILGIAQTGTGKTFAFGLPVLERLKRERGRALIILPTRELAHQVNDALKPLAKTLQMNTVVFVGGESMRNQIRDLSRGPKLMIATPGRLIDLLEQKVLHLRDVSFLVLDEADRMFDMGFAPQLNAILQVLPKQRQTFLFSATMPKPILKLTSAHMTKPTRIEVAPQGTTSDHIEQEVYILPRKAKFSFLENLLKENQGTTLVFSRTKHDANKITRELRRSGHRAVEIHANRTQAQRNEALQGFKSGKYRILVATDVASRGIDVHNIEVVINYDLPDNSEDYVHRIGRTGRAGKSGKALSFACPDQKRKIRLIEKLIRKNLKISSVPSLKPMALKVEKKKSGDFKRRFRKRSKARAGLMN